MFFLQCGARISQINELIEQRYGRSFATTGASNGQTIAGAIGTGTHGSALDHGPLHQQVVGLHLITHADQHVWLERASQPATRDTAFADLVGANLRRDDGLFEAALVSFGAMGFVAGVMIETRPLFRLRASRSWQRWDAGLQAAVQQLDFSNQTLPGITPGTQPYFFMPIINAFDLNKVSVTAMEALPYNGEPIDYTRNRRDETGPGVDLLCALGGILNVVGTPEVLVNRMADLQLKPFADRIGTWGETFDLVRQLNGTIGSSIGVDISDAKRAVDILIDEQHRGPAAPLAFALRFVRHGGSTLEFTRFPLTCAIDVDGIRNDRTLDFYARIWARLEQENVAFTQHWGKHNNYDTSNVTERFGANVVQDFRSARQRLLPDNTTRRLFANPLLERVGLAS